MGVLKSIDGGLSWAKINNGLTGLSVWALAIDPTNADVVYIVTYPGDAKIFKSTNGGGQWRQLPISLPAEALVSTLAIDPMTPSIVYAAYAVLASDFDQVGPIDRQRRDVVRCAKPAVHINALAIDQRARANLCQ
jgi:hypothetical protein